MKLKYKNKKTAGFTLVELLVVIAIIAALAAISSPIILRQISRSRATQALNNGKDIYVGLRDFAFNRAGVTPSQVSEATPGEFASTAASTDSNTALRKLFTSGVVTDEKPFFVKGLDATSFMAGDENTTGAAALAAGENVFSYFLNRNIQQDKADTPILAVPTSTTAATLYAGTFQIAPFGGQASIIFTDGAGVIFGINETTAATATTPALGTLVDEDGADLVAPSARTPAGEGDSGETETFLPPLPVS